jgi:hypothetical protein
MVIYALDLSLFFAVLWRRDRAGQIKLFLQLLCGMLLGGLAVAWLMYPFPAAPPSPIP